MNQILNVHLLPELAHPHDLAGHTSVVVDVLRASTTITTAVDSGAEKIVPCLAVEEARQLATQRPGALLGGERQGKKLPGFDFGNSPAEYTPDRIRGKTLVFTTTNGTKAMTRCMGSSRILIGSIVNRSAICEAVASDGRVDIICAGTNDEFSMDDALAAGAIASGLGHWHCNDGAKVCRQLWESQVVNGDQASIRKVLANSVGGSDLIAIGMDSDLDLAADLDRFSLVPKLDRSTWEISQAKG